ncbi:acyl-CoA dehydrogenase family protein [Pseudooceanicola sp.]|uniref:acyl-CoA dehydrogenase family protein n=1 Tax=Pseudooceanicola sp. TaxID=1914328 RepID=UPI0026208FF0|nr:acyl-CoA dehydrogenase family protein [Pseudooceanicola sp.]MDF1857161.1 acyl-CoA dehydrogenase family protein [Pseudooceanicola sp.]
MSDTADLAEFRQEVSDFVAANCPADIRARVASYHKIGVEDQLAWQRILAQKGWGASTWPVEWGGTGWSVRQRFIFDEVQAEFDCPPAPHQGLRHIGPVLIAFGSPEQQQAFLPRILDGSDFWCQGYSEPNAGSDLANLGTNAVLDGDDYVVNGQKIWTTQAHESQMMFALVRTGRGDRKQHGISLLLIPMDSPGLEVRPIISIDGWHHLNEVFFTDVRVPVANRVGDEGAAWTYAKFLLDRERLGPVHQVPGGAVLARRVRELIETEVTGPARQGERAALLGRLARVDSRLMGLRRLGEEAIEALAADRPVGLSPSVIKLAFGALFQELTEIGAEAGGRRQALDFTPPEQGNHPDEAEWLPNFLYQRARTIFGGTSEVQRNLISRRLFGN